MTDPVVGFLALLEGVRAAGDGQWTAKCPAHPDQHPSLSVSRGDDGRLLARCHTGCTFKAILAAVGWKERDAFPGETNAPPRPPPAKRPRNEQAFDSADAAIKHLTRSLAGKCTGAWAYQDTMGHEVFRIVRFDGCRGTRPKQYRPLHRDSKRWRIADPPGPLPLFGLPELIEATVVWVCEGEKCANIFRELGLLATTNAHGAKSVDKSDWSILAGKIVIICPDRGAAGEKHLKDVLAQLSRLIPAPTIKVVRLPVTNDGDDIEQFVGARRAHGVSDAEIRLELEQLAAAGGDTNREQELVIVRLSDVAPQAQPYLWPGRIPSASGTLVGGKQGCTKNLFAYDIIARVTTGSPWPDDILERRSPPRSVILLEAEEHLESSIVPRVAAASADLSRVLFIKGAPTANPKRHRLISIQQDAERIEKEARRAGDVALVVVSPITSYLGNIEQNSNEQVRNEIIYPLKMLAESLGCAVVILKHPNKDWRNNDPLERIGGSAAWTEAMRCVVFIGDDPDEAEDEPNPLRCAHWVKFSIGHKPGPLSWKVRVADSGAPAIQYLDTPITFSAAEMLTGRRKTEERKTKRECAAEWIMATLEGGPSSAAALTDAALKAVNNDRQFSMDAFERARQDLRDANRIVFQRKPETNPAEWWYWRSDSKGPDWYAPAEAQPTSA